MAAGGAGLEAEGMKASIGVRHTYDVKSERWGKEECSIMLAERPFAKGGMRVCHRVLCGEYAGGGEGRAGVAKVFKKGILPKHVEAKAYFDEAMTQTLADSYAAEFNNRRLIDDEGRPVSLQFLPVAVMQIFGKQCMLCNVEPFLEGKYVKHNDNDGNVGTQDEAPQAFSHFTWDLSRHRLVICDLQGVGGFLTDPQVHSEDGKGFGMGNIGKEGITKFLSSHKCNSLCRQLGLKQPVERDGEWHAELSPENHGARESKGAAITSGWMQYDSAREAGLSSVESCGSSKGASRETSPHARSARGSPLPLGLLQQTDQAKSKKNCAGADLLARFPANGMMSFPPARESGSRTPIASVKAKVSKLFSMGKGVLGRSNTTSLSPFRRKPNPPDASNVSPLARRSHSTAPQQLEAARSPLLVALPACASKDLKRHQGFAPVGAVAKSLHEASADALPDSPANASASLFGTMCGDLGELVQPPSVFDRSLDSEEGPGDHAPQIKVSQEDEADRLQILEAWINRDDKRGQGPGKITSSVFPCDSGSESGTEAGKAFSRAESVDSAFEEPVSPMWKGRKGSVISDASTLSRLASGAADMSGSRSPEVRDVDPAKGGRPAPSKKEKIAEMQSELVALKAQLQSQMDQVGRASTADRRA